MLTMILACYVYSKKKESTKDVLDIDGLDGLRCLIGVMILLRLVTKG